MSMNGEYASIDSDEWQDAGKIYRVVKYFRRNPDSTAVELTIEHDNGLQETRVVPCHWIKWQDNGDF